MANSSITQGREPRK